MLVQTQNTDEPGAELVFTRVRRFTFDEQTDIEPGQISRAPAGVDKDILWWTFRFLNCEVVARSCTITPIDSDILGPGPYYWPTSVGTTDDLDAY
jgi:hypothetical protein